ncbi:NYN domain-containing protein [Pigmentiphaga soli]
MALFCDFENVALGVRDAKYEKFDIGLVLERLLLKGSTVVKKAYCDWERYKSFKAVMHEANFELIDIPHVRQSGKNSADIRMVVDALDLCYTKSHVDTFVIISGDSDFSPLVSKLRENAKQVIGVGVKQSTSDLLIANCDEFIFYDDLVRVQRAGRRDTREAQPARREPAEEPRRDDIEKRRAKGIALAVETFDALVAERGDSGKIWASMLKEAVKRRRPDFNESYFGFRSFGNLLEAAQAKGLLEVGRDEKSGTFVFRNHGGAEAADVAAGGIAEPVAAGTGAAPAEAPETPPAQQGRRERGRRSGGRGRAGKGGAPTDAASAETAAAEAVPAEAPPDPAAPEDDQATPGEATAPIPAPVFDIGPAGQEPSMAPVEGAAVPADVSSAASAAPARRRRSPRKTGARAEAQERTPAGVAGVEGGVSPESAGAGTDGAAADAGGEAEAPPARKRSRKTPARKAAGAGTAAGGERKSGGRG